jgi:hypothetical protein
MDVYTSNRIADNLEKKYLNRIGYIPAVGSVSASVRGTVGLAQLVTGVSVTALSVPAALIGSTLGQDEFAKRSFKRVDSYSHLALHGALNCGRAALESVPFLPLMTTLPYDHFLGPMLDYQTETVTLHFS